MLLLNLHELLPALQSRNKTQLGNHTHFSQELYRHDIRAIDWNAIVSENTKLYIYNDRTNSITRAVEVVIDKHVPIRTALRNKQKELRKPWITNATLKTI